MTYNDDNYLHPWYSSGYLIILKSFGTHIYKRLSIIRYTLLCMKEKIRIVRQVGNSLSLTIPKECGLLLGEYVRIKKDGDIITITKVD